MLNYNRTEKKIEKYAYSYNILYWQGLAIPPSTSHCKDIRSDTLFRVP